MRPLYPSLGAALLVVGIASAQVAGDASGNMPQLPVGQVFKQFEFPVYQDGKLRYTLNADEARGITLNRAETTDLKILVYDNGVKTTTITSPKADLYVAEQKMRTKNTVTIDRDDMQATSQDCDFDVKTKKYLLRNNVKVVLKHFDIAANPAGKKAVSSQPTTGATPAPVPEATPQAVPDALSTTTPAPVPEPTPAPAPMPSTPTNVDPAARTPTYYGDTNSAPIPPSRSESK